MPPPLPTRPLLRLSRSHPSPTAFCSSRPLLRPLPCPGTQHRTSPAHSIPSVSTAIRSFHASPATQRPPSPPTNSDPAVISTDTYHALADAYIDALVLALEEKIESGDPGEMGWEVEYSAGVLTIVTPHGSYVLNKQPPNRQIWISSPTSGPKRYDWVAVKGGRDGMGEEGARGEWVYLRDGSRLTGLVEEELGVQVRIGEDE